MSHTSRRPWGRDDAGLTLIELMVTMVLLSVVGTLVVGATIQATRILTHTRDEAIGLGDAKVILDRLSRDIREARSAVCDGLASDPTDPTNTADPLCEAHLQLWIDANSNYAQEPEEIVTWQLRRNPDLEHWDVWRVVGPLAAPVSERRQATSLLVHMAFDYDGATAETATRIDIRMNYDAILGRGTQDRYASFSALLRNKG